MFELNEEVRARRTRSKENVEVEGRDSGVFTHHNTNSLQSEVELQYQSHLSSAIADINIYHLNLHLLASTCFHFTSVKTPGLKECERRWKKHNPLKSVEMPTFFSLECKKDAVLALPKTSSNIPKHLNCISTQFCFSSSEGDAVISSGFFWRLPNVFTQFCRVSYPVKRDTESDFCFCVSHCSQAWEKMAFQLMWFW